MPAYLFFRDKGFYPIDARDDADAIKQAECNPGTQSIARVDRGYGIRTIWEAAQPLKPE